MATCAVVALGLLFSIAPATGAPTTRTANCVAQGARHVDGKRVTTTYWVDLVGVTCEFAKPWVAKLTHTRPAKYDAEGKLTGGPRGWTCLSGRGYPALAFKGGGWYADGYGNAKPKAGGEGKAGESKSEGQNSESKNDSSAAKSSSDTASSSPATAASSAGGSSSTASPAPATSTSSSSSDKK